MIIVYICAGLGIVFAFCAYGKMQYRKGFFDGVDNAADYNTTRDNLKAIRAECDL